MTALRSFFICCERIIIYEHKNRIAVEECQIVERYAQKYSLSVEEVFKKALFERIEDECAIAFAKEAYNEYIKSGKKTRPIDELWKELDI